MTEPIQLNTDKTKLIENVIEVKTFIVNLRCPKCKDGMLLHVKSKLKFNPSHIPHKCSKCDEIVVIRNKMYPSIEYADKGKGIKDA